MVGNMQEAFSYMHSSLQMNPYDEGHLLNLAQTYYRNEQPEKALELVDIVLSINSNNHAAHVHKGTILKHAGQLPDALQYF